MEDVKAKVRFIIPVKPKGKPEMVDFYSHGLGFQVVNGKEVLLGKDGGIGLFLYREKADAVSGISIIRIWIERDFGVFCRHLKECGAKFKEIARMPAGYAARLWDPSGNLITLLCDEDDEKNDEIIYSWEETVTID
ncbi:VOC family protein [Burkholderia stagnalis]|uniref:VOC family protein n=1 Tax=Burkholderia stagnalis TaxID=1503054 RepID=A0ABX9YEL6_9BURK|nr:VOC family protein [Burkholderia stagnalis]MDY7807471.1 VOC family protein [Burkholderia stagnalis]RQQ45787.1 VOC family protein [Burkholderia stagnalis]RQQ58819.1 VOC family protein [Burkholderia stagnalis]RQQ58825.1 VOC family protein [Burkholderia stagnalis]RQQ72875.1 VOC family protein [Burkholderia stagnalis]